jgi:hypothetical protein
MTALSGGLAPSAPGGSWPPGSGGFWTSILLALPVLLLGSCASSGPDLAASQVLEEVLESHRASINGIGVQPPAPVARAAPGGGRAAPGSVAALVGQTPDGVLAALGQPTRRRPEGDAEIWLYQGSHCALDVVLYRDARTSRVAWASARASGTEARTEARCLSELTAG